MHQERRLTEEQLAIFKDMQKELNEASQQAQLALTFVQNKRKALDDAIALTSSLLGYDKTLVRLDLDKGIIFQDLLDKAD